MAEDKACQRAMREVRASKRMPVHVLSSAMDIAGLASRNWPLPASGAL
jgi:hypothetical protein